MDLRLIECFKTLAETLSFSATAKKLKLSQSTVSKSIESLELIVNINLFHRNRRSVNLSTAGLHFKTHVLPRYEEMLKAIHNFSEGAKNASGLVRLGVLFEIGKTIASNFISDFLQKHPDIHVDIHLESNLRIIEQLTAGTLDFGITTTPHPHENILSYKFWQEDVVVIASTKYPQNFNKKSELEFVTYRESDVLYKNYLLEKRELLKGRKYRVRCTINSFDALMSLVAQNNYLAVVPRHIINNKYKQDIAIIDTLSNKNQIYLLSHAPKSRGHKENLFLNFLKIIPESLDAHHF